MVEQLAKDYAQYFRKIEVGKEISPICATIEEMMARLEEFEALLVTVKSDSNITMQHNIPEILAQKPNFEELCQRIDSLEKFVALVAENLKKVEQTVEIAEEELGVVDYSLKGIFKPLFAKPRSPNNPRTNLENEKFKSPLIFKTSDYFPGETDAAAAVENLDEQMKEEIS